MSTHYYIFCLDCKSEYDFCCSDASASYLNEALEALKKISCIDAIRVAGFVLTWDDYKLDMDWLSDHDKHNLTVVSEYDHVTRSYK
jgi:hypothetical protein